MERIRAMDPLLGEAVAAARAVELAVSEGWNSVIFESDSRLLCLDISHPFRVPCWKIEELVSSIHAAFESAKHSHKCAPSSCGNIHNIRYPFRLMRDPADCGDSRYSLSCVNNRILVFYLFGGKYYVREVSYDRFNIRVVDSGMQMDKYSSIPPLYSKSQ
ncbi:hypothetical protein CJ030_MR3G026145 [Morella rubra]|uniref:Wall-associated receptor kinase galacturonan-binding domain-containing protein n=1 Tax=Morella rubra TaxID=262757 RepID=A0A6A1VZN1_9ROSI|nr:hypothetical protein CJ030_MR3G026145 [Morella rubra]